MKELEAGSAERLCEIGCFVGRSFSIDELGVEESAEISIEVEEGGFREVWRVIVDSNLRSDRHGVFEGVVDSQWPDDDVDVIEVGFHAGRLEGRRVFVLEQNDNYVIANVFLPFNLLRIIHCIGQECRNVEHHF